MSHPKVSFEFFPPRNLEASFRLWDCVNVLAPLAPDFISVTYGAGGTTRQLTHEAVTTLHRATGLPVAAHLTCVNASRAETLEIAETYAQAGVTQIVALRGDAPKGEAKFTAHPEGFASSVELISALADTGKFTLRVGAYPEKHPEASSLAADIDWLKAKLSDKLIADLAAASARRQAEMPEFVTLGRSIEWTKSRQARQEISLSLATRLQERKDDIIFRDQVRKDLAAFAQKGAKVADVKLDAALEQEKKEGPGSAAKSMRASRMRDPLEDDDWPEYDIQLQEALRIAADWTALTAGSVAVATPKEEKKK